MVGVAEDDGCAYGSQIVGRHGLDRAHRADRHENRRRNVAVRRVQYAGSGSAVLSDEFKNM